MVLKLLTVFLILILLLVFYQDLKKRTIHISLPIIIFIVALVINYNTINLSFNIIPYNIAFVLINILGLVAYFSLKAKGFVNPIDKLIGLGDVVFFIVITPLFNLKSFILFFILSLMFSLLLYSISQLFKKTQSIPLAGYMSLFLIAIIFAKNILQINILV